MSHLRPRRPCLKPWYPALVCLLVLSCTPAKEKAQDNATPPPFSVAVAANFYPTAQKIAALYQKESGAKVELSQGSSGKLFAQITEGAPFELFLSADAERPARLHKEGHQKAEAPSTFALGKLALVCGKRAEAACQELSSLPSLSPETLRAWLLQRSRLAVADPGAAPYGQAAMETFKALGISEEIQPSLVMGQSVAQAFHFAETDNVEVAFVAASQARSTGRPSMLVPSSLHAPLRHDAVVLRASERGRDFLKFLKQNPQARALISEAGYSLPDAR